MEIQNTIESLLKELMTPIIENAVENAFARHKSIFSQPDQLQSSPDFLDYQNGCRIYTFERANDIWVGPKSGYT